MKKPAGALLLEDENLVLAKRRRQDTFSPCDALSFDELLYGFLGGFSSVIPWQAANTGPMLRIRLTSPPTGPIKAVVTAIDDGLYKSIMRSDQALSMGATHIIFDNTYGG